MSREQVLERKLHALHTLDEAVRALRSLSAQHFRIARGLLPAARAYRNEIAPLVGITPDASPSRAVLAPGPTAIVLITADLGLVGDYTPRLVREALALRAERGPGPLLCLGRRALAPLERAAVRPDRIDPAPASAGGLPAVLLPLVDHILSLRREGRLGSLWLVAARFAGAGQFQPVRVPVLPLDSPSESSAIAASPYSDPARLRAVVVREYLYATLYTTLIEALASEHGKRLVTAESARSWLAERMEKTRRVAAALRRESSTQEVIEVVTASRAGRHAGVHR